MYLAQNAVPSKPFVKVSIAASESSRLISELQPNDPHSGNEFRSTFASPVVSGLAIKHIHLIIGKSVPTSTNKSLSWLPSVAASER